MVGAVSLLPGQEAMTSTWPEAYCTGSSQGESFDYRGMCLKYTLEVNSLSDHKTRDLSPRLPDGVGRPPMGHMKRERDTAKGRMPYEEEKDEERNKK